MKIISINEPQDFALFKKSKIKFHSPYFLLVCKSKPDLQPKDVLRFAIIATKKIGNSVTRNKIKRKIRASMQQLAESINSNFDYLFIPRTALAEADFSQLKEEILKLSLSLSNTNNLLTI